MKVLQINVVYKRGSTGKIVYDIHQGLISNDLESIVCYGRGTTTVENNIHKTSSELEAKINNLRSRITGLQYNGALFSTSKLIEIINKEKPDIVHLHCINGYFVNIYRLLDFLRVNEFKTVLTLHAEFMHTGSCGYSFDCEKWITGCGNCPQLRYATNSLVLDRTDVAWNLMKSSFNKFDNIIIVAVSKWLKERAEVSPILKDKKVLVVENGIDTKNIFHPVDIESVKTKYNINNEKVILHVTASFMSDIKGGKYVIELAKRMQHENVKFIVVGFDGQTNVEIPPNLILIRHTENQDQLAQLYSLANITLLTSKKETFSMPCAESLSCGTPIVGFKAGGPETISLEDFSEFVEFDNVDLLEIAVKKWLKSRNVDKYEIAKRANARYSSDIMINNYIYIYNNFEKILKEG